jgi:thiol:disulfide interchange protein DsbD
MYPIITGMILGQESRSKKQTFTLSLSYVQGMALTYTILGLIVAQAGLGFQAALQQPAILIPLSLLFILLASAMFGLFTFQLPSRWQTALAELSNRSAGGPYLSTFIMGAISGLICSPCTTAPLSGALLYIAQTGNLLTGGLALYALALGMGMPLIAATVFGRQVLPNAGSWMEKVKVGFGFVLLSVPILLLERLLPDTLIPWLWALLASSAAIWLISMIRNAKPRMKLILTFFSLALLIASWKPVLFSQHITPLPFTAVTNVQTLNAALQQARREGRPVMLDTYADWCIACKEFEKYTFSNEQVQTLLSNYMLIKIDVTNNSADDQALLSHLQIQGLPTLLFWQADGKPNQRATINGFMTADKFIAHLRTRREQ